MLELASVLFLGVLAQWIAWRIRIPAILPLIIMGLLVGPISSLYTASGAKLIDPMYQEATHSGIFAGKTLFYFVSLAIGIILFEGGLTLKRREFKGVGPSIIKLITIGVLVSFIGGAILAHYVTEVNWNIALLFGGLITVTGPTVIAPILRNVPLNRNVATVLKWEGILIDPIGALVAVLVFEFIVSGQSGGEFSSTALLTFGKIVVVGLALGVAMGYFLYFMITRELIPHYLLNVFTLGTVISSFALSDVIAHESGLLTVVVYGMVVGNLKMPHFKEILDFKESLTVLLISVLFILLSANMNIEQLKLLIDARALLLFAGVILLLRPLGVFLSTIGSDLNFREKVFISWIGPRGIVAAGIASLFGLKLSIEGIPGAEMITPLVFLIVLGTVLLNATTANMLAKALGVVLDASNGVLIVGANAGARLIARFLQDHGRHVALVDNSATMVEEAREMGLEAYQANVFDDEMEDRFELLDMGYMFAMTGSSGVNLFVCRKFKDLYGENGTYRLLTREEITGAKECPENAMFSRDADYLNFSEIVRDYPALCQLELHSKKHFEEVVKRMDKLKNMPLFILDANSNKFKVVLANRENLEVKEGDLLVYIGEELNLSDTLLVPNAV